MMRTIIMAAFALGLGLALGLTIQSVPVIAAFANCAGTGGSVCQYFAIPQAMTVGSGANQIPTCGANTKGLRAYVSDQNTAVAYNGSVTSGGSTNQWISCDGTNWRQG